MYRMKITTVKFTIAGGSRAESMAEKGATQLLSTAAFAGTSKRSGLKLMRDLENMGAVASSSFDREKVQTYN